MVTRPSARVLTTEKQWDELAHDWDDLQRNATGATAFQSFSFLRCWWKQFARGRKLFIVVATDGNRLVGIAPLQLACSRSLGKKYRVLQFIGMPDELDRPRFLVRHGDVDTMNSLLNCIIAAAEHWDLIELEEVESDFWQIAPLRAWADKLRLSFRSTPFHPVPYLCKSGSWQEFLQTRSLHFRKRLHERERKVRKKHRLHYRSSHGGPATGRLVEQFFAIEARSWKVAKGLDVGSAGGYRGFYGQLLRHDSDALRGHAIVQYIDDKESAATLGFSSNDTYYSLQIAHDTRYNKLSPGSLLEDLEMKWFFENDHLKRYEFLGGAGMNKSRWTDDAIDTVTLEIGRRGIHKTLADLLRFLLRR